MNKSSRLSTAESANSRSLNLFAGSSIQSIKCSVGGSSGQMTAASQGIETTEAVGKRQRFIHAQLFSNMFKDLIALKMPT